MKRSIFQIVGLLLLLPLFSGCNDSDDVAAIFTGKTWKLNYITVTVALKLLFLALAFHFPSKVLVAITVPFIFPLITSPSTVPSNTILYVPFLLSSLILAFSCSSFSQKPKTIASKLKLPLQVVMATTNSPKIL